MAVSFLHIADLHLDSPFKSITKVSKTLGQQMKQASKQSFERLMTVAIEKEVDIIIIAGDSFNSDKPSISTQLFFKQQLERAIQANIHVVLCFGNHDYVHHTLLVPLPTEVFVFPKEVTTFHFTAKSGETVSISGFSYYTNHISERIVTQYPVKETVDYHIGVLHGELLGDASRVGDYAPFSLSELNDKQYDYWALGHIHKRQLLQTTPPIAYSGSIQGLNRKELDEKGGYLVTLQKQQFAEVTPINTASIIWQEVHQTITKSMTIEQIVSQFQSIYTTLQTTKTYLLSVIWEIESGVDTQIVNTIVSDDFKAVLSQNHISVIKQLVNYSNDLNVMSLNAYMQSIWQDLQQNGLSDTIYQDIMQSVFQHRYITLLLPNLKDDESLKEEIMQAALTRIQQNLEEDSHEN